MIKKLNIDLFFFPLLGALLLIVAYSSPFSQNSFEKYASFHTIIDILSVTFSLMIFVLNWSLSFKNPKFLRSILCNLFLAIAIFDFLHVFSNSGLPQILWPTRVENAIFFWLGAGGVYATSFLFLIFVSDFNEIIKRKTFYISLILNIVVIAFFSWIVMLNPENLPKNVTSQKHSIEIVMSVINFYTATTLLRKGTHFSKNKLDFALANAMFIIFIFGICFSLYMKNEDVMNATGNIIKLGSYIFIYRTLIRCEIQYPNEELETHHKNLEQVIA